MCISVQCVLAYSALDFCLNINDGGYPVSQDIWLLLDSIHAKGQVVAFMQLSNVGTLIAFTPQHRFKSNFMSSMNEDWKCFRV